MKIQYQSTQVTVFESALFRTTSSVIVNDDLILIVDPNWLPSEVADIKNHVEKVKKNQSIYLLFTHSDYDHIIGYQAFPAAKTIASQSFVENAKKDEIIQEIKKFDDQYYITRDYEIKYPEIDIVIKNDEQVMNIGNTKLTFYQAKGHNPDGIFTIVENLGIWIAGDYLSNVEFPYIYFSSVDYMETLAKVDLILKNHAVDLLIPGHGDCTRDLDEIKKRTADSQEYIQALRSSIQRGETFDFNQLMKSYHFPIIMKSFHDGNVDLIKKERGK